MSKARSNMQLAQIEKFDNVYLGGQFFHLKVRPGMTREGVRL